MCFFFPFYSNFILLIWFFNLYTCMFFILPFYPNFILLIWFWSERFQIYSSDGRFWYGRFQIHSNDDWFWHGRFQIHSNDDRLLSDFRYIQFKKTSNIWTNDFVTDDFLTVDIHSILMTIDYGTDDFFRNCCSKNKR